MSRTIVDEVEYVCTFAYSWANYNVTERAARDAYAIIADQRSNYEHGKYDPKIFTVDAGTICTSSIQDRLISRLLSTYFFVGIFHNKMNHHQWRRIVVGTKLNVMCAILLFDFLKRASQARYERFHKDKEQFGNNLRKTFLNKYFDTLSRGIVSERLEIVGDKQRPGLVVRRNLDKFCRSLLIDATKKNKRVTLQSTLREALDSAYLEEGIRCLL